MTTQTLKANFSYEALRVNASVILGLLRGTERLTDVTPQMQTVNSFLKQYELQDPIFNSNIMRGDRSAIVIFTKNSEKRVLKVYNTRYQTIPRMQEEINFTAYLNNQGVPSPKILDNKRGKLISKVHCNDNSWIGVVMEFAYGSHPNSYSTRLLRDMGRTQARLHTIGEDYYTTYRNPAISLPKGAVSILLRWLPTGLSHFDLSSDNIVVRNGRVNNILDFDGMRHDPLIVCTLFSLMCIYKNQPDVISLETYLLAYGSVRTLTSSERILIRLVFAIRYLSPKMLWMRF